ncbi:hypothetical protein D3C87_77790 [compost metagenome]
MLITSAVVIKGIQIAVSLRIAFRTFKQVSNALTSKKAVVTVKKKDIKVIKG